MTYSETINGAKITNWESFHDEFQQQMGFFDGYGRNGDAWIDCMTDMYTDGEYKSLTKFDLNEGDTCTLKVINAEEWKNSDLESYEAFIEWSNAANTDKTYNKFLNPTLESVAALRGMSLNGGR